MSISFMVALGGTLVAAVGTIAAVVRFARTPRADVIAWALATAGLTIALAAQALGYRRGFAPTTFRAVQIGAQLVAPLALAWGITEVAARSVPGRFMSRLALSALFAVSGVILGTDPLAAHSFGTSWPPASAHYQFPSSQLLLLIAAVAVITAVVGTIMAGVRARGSRAWRNAFVAVGLATLAVVAAEGLAVRLPANSGYPALTLLAAVLAILASVLACRFQPPALRAVAGPGDDAGGARRSRAAPGTPGGTARMTHLACTATAVRAGTRRRPAGTGGTGGYGGYGDADYGGPDADYEGPVTGAFEGPLTGEFERPPMGGFDGPDTGGFDGPVTGAFEAPAALRGFEGPDTGSFDGPVTGAFDPLINGNGLAGPDDDGLYRVDAGLAAASPPNRPIWPSSTARSPSTRCSSTAQRSSTGWPSRSSSRCGRTSLTPWSTWSTVSHPRRCSGFSTRSTPTGPLTTITVGSPTSGSSR